MAYKWCIVPLCTSTSIKTPEKLFVSVPTNPERRKMWLEMSRRDPNSISSHTNVFMCEDHFDLPNNMENYIRYKVMGSVSHVRLKPGCFPTKFDCQPDTTGPIKLVRKNRRKILIGESIKKLPEKSTLVESDSSVQVTVSRNRQPAETLYNVDKNTSLEPIVTTKKSTEIKAARKRIRTDEKKDHLPCRPIYQPKKKQLCGKQKLSKDMENYMEYSIMGSVPAVRMKPSCLPSKFECQPERLKRTAKSMPRAVAVKRQRATTNNDTAAAIRSKPRAIKKKTATNVSCTSEDINKSSETSSSTHCRASTKIRNASPIPEIKLENNDIYFELPLTKQFQSPKQRKTTNENDGSHSAHTTQSNDHNYIKKQLDLKITKEHIVKRKLTKTNNGTKLKTKSCAMDKSTRKRKADVKLPKPEEIITRVYEFLQAEYKFLKEYIGDICDLSPLINVMKRTADACGVSKYIVRDIVYNTRSYTELNSPEDASDCVDSKKEQGNEQIEDNSLISEESSKTDSVEQEDVQGEDDSEQPAEHEVEAPNIKIHETQYLDPIKTEPAEHETEYTGLSPHSISQEDTKCGVLHIEFDYDNGLTGDKGCTSDVLPTPSIPTIKTEPDDLSHRYNITTTIDTTLCDVKCEPPDS